MRESVDLAMNNVEKGLGGPFGCVIVKDGKIVGRGANSVTRLKDPTLHAEVCAIKDACRNLDTFKLVIWIIFFFFII